MKTAFKGRATPSLHNAIVTKLSIQIEKKIKDRRTEATHKKIFVVKLFDSYGIQES